MCQDRPVSEVEMDNQCLTMSLFWKYVGPQFTQDYAILVMKVMKTCQSVTKSTLYRNKKCKSSATKTGWVSAWVITPIFKISFAQNRYFQNACLMIHLCNFWCYTCASLIAFLWVAFTLNPLEVVNMNDNHVSHTATTFHLLPWEWSIKVFVKCWIPKTKTNELITMR